LPLEQFERPLDLILINDDVRNKASRLYGYGASTFFCSSELL